MGLWDASEGLRDGAKGLGDASDSVRDGSKGLIKKVKKSSTVHIGHIGGKNT
jgi:hypothetical protein